MSADTIILSTTNPPLAVEALRGDTAPTLTGGVGGWQEVARPRRVALLQWQGRSPFRMTISMLLDGLALDLSVEADCEALRQMGLPVAAGGEPPVVTVIGAVPKIDGVWVVDTIDWGDATYSSLGYRVRQAVTVTLVARVQDDRVTILPAAEQIRRQQTAAAIATGFTTTGAVIAKAGDTLLTIAARLTGNAKNWPALADANGIRDPNSVKPGDTIRTP